MQHTTTASYAACRHCRRSLIYAWDEGLLVRADANPLDDVVSRGLRNAGRHVYALTRGRYLILETADRVGALRMVVSRHAEHVCRQADVRDDLQVQPGLF